MYIRSAGEAGGFSPVYRIANGGAGALTCSSMVNQESARQPVTLLALDFDAALKRQASDPAAVRLDPAAAEFLTAAAGVPGIVLAIASDRDVKDLASRVGSSPAYLIASDGLESTSTCLPFASSTIRA